MTEWAQLSTGLAAEMTRLGAGSVLRIGEDRTESPRFAQLRQLDDRIWAELVGDRWLGPEARAGAEGARILSAAGWQPPDADHGDNWWVEWSWPLSSARYRALAAMIVEGLRDAFGIADPSVLTYVAWDESDGNRPLDLPALGLTRQN
ncbi:hypothetical protein GV791_30355 [Nocardia cyriacigeorgica]|uniref:TY-Chap N-terminal domain-containing protein n=1 Tax=Nocardia cyriacigeorgica TaxID=135487 RepID=A0A6P1CZN3_9NOCA|nr:hypothetical protein [Nocardia cyriacigeorgica]NEW36826.1 hypothetical protein [Nocardia cyriacigeorgica]